MQLLSYLKKKIKTKGCVLRHSGQDQGPAGHLLKESSLFEFPAGQFGHYHKKSHGFVSRMAWSTPPWRIHFILFELIRNGKAHSRKTARAWLVAI